MINARSSIWNSSRPGTRPASLNGVMLACDPDNRLIAAQLERNWEIALRRVRDLETRKPVENPMTIAVDPGDFANLAENLSAV